MDQGEEDQAVRRVLLVLVGALGDLAWRKFLGSAKTIESHDPDVAVMLVDVPWVTADVSLANELRWRIARRRIELYAENVAARKIKGLNLKSPLGSEQFPWNVDEFFERCLSGNSEVLESERRKLDGAVNDWIRYFMEVNSAGLMRYQCDFEKIHDRLKELKEEGWKIALLVATPPKVYATVVEKWSSVADRILLEKPAGCLNPETMLYTGTAVLRRAVSQIQPPTQIANNDHYNSKLIVRIMERVRDYHLFDRLLKPARIKRIVVQLLEPAPLPSGRYGFYDGAGGAFGDMVPHLLQAVRGILGIAPTELKIDFQKFCWARYNIPAFQAAPTVIPYSYEPHYYQLLSPQTETFVAFKAFLEVEGVRIPLYCRTGKGVAGSATKSLRIVTRYGDTDYEIVSLIFDMNKNSLTIREDSKPFLMSTGSIELSEPFQSGVPLVDTNEQLFEYESVFNALIKSEWTGDALDRRYFPDVEQAADLSDLIFEKLVQERSQSRVVSTYLINDDASFSAINNFLDDEAHWGQAL
jgi:glucose-6-phosphate 1-dehydrogenase